MKYTPIMTRYVPPADAESAVAEAEPTDAPEPLPSPDATRRPDVPSVPVTLADGKSWRFAAARLRIRPEFHADGSVTVVNTWGYPPKVQAVVSQLTDAWDADPGSVTLALLFKVCQALLCAAHDVTDDQAARLLTIPPERVADLLASVAAAIAGEEPAEADTEPHPTAPKIIEVSFTATEDPNPQPSFTITSE